MAEYKLDLDDGGQIGTNGADSYALSFATGAGPSAAVDARGGADAADFGAVAVGGAVTFVKDAGTGVVSVTSGGKTFALSNFESFKFANGTISAATADAPQYIQNGAVDLTLLQAAANVGDTSLVQKWNGAILADAGPQDWSIASVNGAAPSGGVIVLAGLGVVTVVDGSDDTMSFKLTKSGVTIGEKIALTVVYKNADGSISFSQTYNIVVDAATDGNDKFVADSEAAGLVGSADFNGGKGDDVLTGDERQNTLEGGEGNDKIWAGKGDVGNGTSTDDVFIGGAGNDEIGGGAGNDILIGDDSVSGGVDGSDTIYGGAGDDTIYGGHGDANGVIAGSTGTAADKIWAGAGDDVIYGADGNDIIGGGAGDDDIYAGKGSDTIYTGAAGSAGDSVNGGDGNDSIFGGEDDGQDFINGGNGDDVIYGGGGNDELFGDAGNDTIYGGAGDDLIVGGAGSDVIEGGAGNDTIDLGTDNGDAAIDTVVFSGNFGQDLVEGFVINEDKIDLSSFKTSFATLSITDEMVGGVASAVIDLGNGNEIVLDGVTKAQLDANDFIF